MFKRSLDIENLLRTKSLLLLGPRMTGKSTLLRERLPLALTIDLLEPRQLLTFSTHPERLAEQVAAGASMGRTVCVIDEIQKLPMLLDEVHRLIERDKSLRFVLTGSSARKLRRSPVNLLAGRARRAELAPIVSQELPDSYAGYRRLLAWGGLPSVLTSTSPSEELRDYVGTYLKEEIMAEGLSRNLSAFSRFLETAALCNGEQVIFANVGSDAELPARTVRDHFQLLEDTLLGTLVPAYRKTQSRKAVAASKFYFFDLGISQSLLSRDAPTPGTPEYSRALEHFIFAELRAAMSYQRLDGQIYYWRTTSQFEVDFIVELPGKPLIAIEVKGSARVPERELKGHRAFAEDQPNALRYVVCEEQVARNTADGIRIRPVAEFLEQLWDHGVASLTL